MKDQEERDCKRMPINWPEGVKLPSIEEVAEAVREGERQLREAAIRMQERIRPLRHE